MNVNFGLLPVLSEPFRRKAKKEMMARRALADMEAWIEKIEADEAFVASAVDPDTFFVVAR